MLELSDLPIPLPSAKEIWYAISEHKRQDQVQENEMRSISNMTRPSKFVQNILRVRYDVPPVVVLC
jgi:hypothetical protein